MVSKKEKSCNTIIQETKNRMLKLSKKLLQNHLELKSFLAEAKENSVRLTSINNEK